MRSLTNFAIASAVALAALGAARPAAADCTPQTCGVFGQPFAEPTILGQPTAEKCIPDAAGDLACKPAGGSVAVLRDGRVLYFNALEGSENIELTLLLEFGQVTVNDQTRVMTLGPNNTATWAVPFPADGGANPNGNHTTSPLLGGGLDNNDTANWNDGALFCADLNFLADGRVIAVGGTDYYSEPGVEGLPLGLAELEGLKNARIFNPTNNVWTQTGSMTYGRWYPTLVTLPSSDLFVASGVTKLVKPVYPDQPLNSGRNVVQTETYDLETGVWSENGALGERTMPLFPRLHLLPNGHVLYNASGQAFNPFGQSYDQALWNVVGAYNPTTKSWTDLAYAGFPLRLNQIGLDQLVSGLNITNPLHLLVLTTSLLNQTLADPGALVGELGRLLGLVVDPQAVETVVGSGFRGSTFSIMLPLKPDAQGNYTKAEFLTGGGVLSGVVATNPGLYFGSNLSRIDTVTTPLSGPMSYSSRLTGKMNRGRWYTSGLLLPDGSVMAFSGADRDEVVVPGLGYAITMAERFNPATEKWTPMASANRQRTYHNTAALLPDGRVLIGGHAPITTAYLMHATLPGGFSPNDGRDPSFEIYSPPYVFRSDRPTILSAPTEVKHGQQFTISVTNAASIQSVMLIRPTSVTHLVDADQRAVELKIVSRNIPLLSTTGTLTLKMPSSRAVAPLGPYMLFINRNTSTGLVPSKSKPVWVRPL